MDLDENEVKKGKVKVDLALRRASMMFELDFQIKGVVSVPCDRCLEDVEIPIETQNRLVVKFGDEYAEESDELVVVPEEEGVISLAWYMYEFIALAIPMKHVHAPGECNEAMASILSEHMAISSDEEDWEEDEEEDVSDDTNNPIDPRWNALKGLLENDNN